MTSKRRSPPHGIQDGLRAAQPCKRAMAPREMAVAAGSSRRLQRHSLRFFLSRCPPGNGSAGYSRPLLLQSRLFVFLASLASKSLVGFSNTCALVLVIDAIPYRARTFVSHSRKVHEFRPVDVNEAPEEFTVPRLFQKPVFADLRRVCPTVKRVDPKCPENRRFRPKLDPKKILRALRLWPKKAQRLGKPP